MTHEKYIARCLELARQGEYYVAPNPMVGAVLVDQHGNTLAEGWHERYGEGHAEVNCFRHFDQLPEDSRPADLHSCTLYVSLEPCSHYGKTPPCSELIISRGVGQVVVGMLDPNPLVGGRGIQMLRNAGISVVVGVLEKECRELNKRFLCLHEQHRPYIILKWAQTADGYMDIDRSALLNSTNSFPPKQGPLRISTPCTKTIVHRMRAENMSIMVGTRTVLLDDPRLLNTHWTGRNPIRITIDRHNVIPKSARIFSDDAETIVYRERTDWQYILDDLAKRNIHSVLVEGGPTLLKHILSTGLWDEAHIEVAPELKLNAPGIAAPDVLYQALENPEKYHISLTKMEGHDLYTLRK